MLATLKDAGGVGIAAPQVYESKQLFIVASSPNPRYPNAPKMKPTVILNPKIVEHSDKKEKGWEGCLSIPGIRAQVPRYKSIKIEFFTREGEKRVRTFKDFIARICQHELEHLNGIVYLDSIETSKDIITEKEYLKKMSRKKKRKN